MDAMSGRGAGQLPIEVWAPNAQQVEIEWTAVPESTDRSQQVHRRRDPMTPTGDGWWRWAGPASGDGDEAASATANASAASAAVDYAFVLDGAEPALPDPRSPWQPHGVHGPEPHLRPRLPSRGPTPTGAGLVPAQACSARWSTSCTSARSPRRAPSTAPRAGSTTWSTSASTSSS